MPTVEEIEAKAREMHNEHERAGALGALIWWDDLRDGLYKKRIREKARERLENEAKN